MLPASLYAQVDGSGVQGGVAEPGPMRAQSPAMGQSYSLGFASEVPRTNYLLGGVTVGSAYDTNVTSSGTEAVSSASYYITPRISSNADSRSHRMGSRRIDQVLPCING